MMRFVLHIAVYAVLGFAMFAATGLLSGRAPLLVAGAIFAAALWSGSLTTFLERWGYTRTDPRERVAWGALLGALSVGGFTGGLSWLAWGRVDTVLVPIGAVLGGVMQAARAFSLGGFTPTDDETETGAPQMDAKSLIAAGALVIDVRSQEEWNTGHLPSAKLVPVDVFESRIPEITSWVGGDKSKPVVVHCAAGGRSARAKAMLERHGFTQVTNGGGYSSLK